MKLNMKNKILLIAIVFSVIISGCTEEKIIEVDTRNISNTSTDSPALQEKSNEESTNLTSSSEPLLQDGENMTEFAPEFTLESFTWIYHRDNANINPRPLFNWDNAPGNDSDILQDYLRKIYGDEFQSGRVNISLISNDSALLSFGQGGGIWLPVKEENGSFIVYDVYYSQGHDISERRYAVYNLSIKNNGSETYRFMLSKLRLNSGTGSSIPASINVISTYPYEGLPFDEIRLGDVSLLPGQITKGYAIFNVDSMHNRSFVLSYNSKPVSLASFENSVLSIEKADLFDYSTAMGKPPYWVSDNFGLPHKYSGDTYDPPQLYTDVVGLFSPIWSNWANRSVVEFFKKLDLKELNKEFNSSKGDFDLPSTYSTYALKVIPGKNISIHPGNAVVITGENNEELISANTAYYSDIAISDNSTFKRFHDNFTDDMNFSNATLVKMDFDNDYGWPMGTRVNRNNQVVILDENRNIVFIGFHYGHYSS